MNKKIVFSVLIIALFLIGFVSAGTYLSSNPRIQKSSVYNSFDTDRYSEYNRSFCQDGQDFIVQIVPGGCTSPVVRSDLLEEEDVDVFCQLQAIKVNPSVNVAAISSIGFDRNYPEGVRSISYYPSTAALNRNGELNGMSWNNIGYVVITLRQERNESAMPDFIEGSIVANMRYDFNKEFGFQKQTFYLPEMSDEDFEKDFSLYSFSNKISFLRASNIEEKSADIRIYSGELNRPFEAGSSERRQVRALKLDTGESGDIRLQSYDCATSFNIKLDRVALQGERARLTINSEVIEVRKGERFLENKCEVRDITKNGLDQSVEIACSEDRKGTSRFTLYITPKVVLSINGESKSYNVGDKVTEDNSGLPIYLAYATSRGDILKTLEVQLVKVPKGVSVADSEKLDEASIAVAKTFVELGYNENKFWRVISKKSIESMRWLIEGTAYEKLTYQERKTVFDQEIYVVGIGGAENMHLERFDDGTLANKNYRSAVEDYDTILNSFFSEEDPINKGTGETVSERGLKEKIKLADELQQKKDLELFCQEFEQSFSRSIPPAICNDKSKLANNGISTREVLINGNNKLISFENVFIPSFNEYGATISFKEKGTVTFDSHDLGVRGTGILSNSDLIELISIDINSVRIRVGTEKFDINKNVYYSYKPINLIKGQDKEVDGNIYRISKINLDRVAKVTVDTRGRNENSKANFSFKIGIEKRLIQLSPEKTKEKIIKLNKSIEKWSKISATLEKVVTTMKTACFATGAAFTLKNAIFNSKSALARESVMNDWRVKCKLLVNNPDESKNEFNTMDACYFKFADEIDEEVREDVNARKKIDAELKTITESLDPKTNILGQKSVDSDKLLEEYSKTVVNEIDTSGDFKFDKKDVENSEIVEILNSKNARENGVFTIENLKNIMLYSDKGMTDKVNIAYEQIYRNNERYNKEVEDRAKAEAVKFTEPFSPIGIKGGKVEQYLGATVSEELLKGEEIGKPVRGIVFTDQKKYYIVLSSVRDNRYAIESIYNFSGDKVSNKLSDTIISKYDYFEKSTKLTKYSFTEKAEVVFFGPGPYQNRPSLVPIDIDEGWYASMRVPTSTATVLRPYDESGRLKYYYLCNVGSDGLVDKTGNLDICIGIDRNNPKEATISTLISIEEIAKLDRIVEIEVAKLMELKDKTGSVMINENRINIGAPETGIVKGDCADFMSPKECKILFNLCDPVICPSSRCDFGGDYRVRDVAASGIVGSIALCLPNYKEGIIAPICLSGVQTGIDAMVAESGAHIDCLQTSLDTGQTVGICDQKNSIYKCELLWKNAIPLAKIGIPKLLGAIAGENTRGGGEYSNVKSAWDMAEESMTFFMSDSYGENALNAFRSRSIGQEEIGGALCKSFVSTAYPNVQSFFKNLVSADSPVQFTAEFNEINRNTITSPPTSHYKVDYRIYAGKDRDAIYKIWLRSPEGSYYEDSARTWMVASGTIRAGEYEAESIDSTQLSGFTELCVSVNEQPQVCGFKKVSSSFSSNYFQDQYRKSEADNKNIVSEAECIAGTPNILSLVNTNIQEGIQDVINPEVYNLGINRVCATENPGYATDQNMGKPKQRWMDVGYCENENLRCWLDLETIDDAFVFDKTTEDLRAEFNDSYSKNFMSENGYLDGEFLDVVKNITEQETSLLKISRINYYMDKIFRNDNKAYLYFLRGNEFGNIAKGYFKSYKEEVEREKNKERDKELLVGPRERIETIFDILGDANFVSSKFEVELEGFDNNLCFIYDKTSWYWTASCDDVGKTLRFGDNIETKLGQGVYTVEWDSVSTIRSEYTGNANSVEANFIKKLRNKDYVSGFETIKIYVIDSKTNSDFVSAENMKMNKLKIFTASKVEGVDDLYFRFDKNENKWKWGSEDYTNVADWMSLDEIKKVEKKGFFDRIKEGLNKADEWLNELTGIKPIILDTTGDMLSVPEEYEILKKLLIKKGFNEGSLILFSGKEAWNRLAEENILVVGVYTVDQALLDLKSLEDDYLSDSVIIDKERVYIETQVLVEKLIDDKLLKPVIEDVFAIDPYESKGIYYYFSEDREPNFEKIRAELKQIQVDRGVGVSGQFSLACVQYSDKVNLEVDELRHVDANLVFAVMMQESKCDTNAESTTKCRGLMQFCAPTAVEYGVCDSRGCSYGDYRYDSDKSIEGGARYLNVLLNRYDKYEDGKLLAIAAYNGGLGVIDLAIKNTDNKINWNNVRVEITPSLLEEFSVYRSSGWDDEAREKKVAEIKDYVEKVLANMGIELPVADDKIEEETVKITQDNEYDEAIKSIEGITTETVLTNVLDDLVEKGLLLKNEADTNDKEEIKDYLRMNKVIDGHKGSGDWNPVSVHNALLELRGDSTFKINKRLIDNFLKEGGITEEEYDKVDSGFFWFNQGETMFFLRGLLQSNYEEVREDTINKLEIEEVEEESCTIPPKAIVESSDIGEPGKRVLEVTRKMEGSFSYIGKAGCFDASNYIFNLADVGINCVYSDKDGKTYDVAGGIETSDANVKGGSVYKVNPKSCSIVDLSESNKLDSIAPGDMISYYSAVEGATYDSPHNAIFIRWINRDTWQAELFDWNGPSYSVGEMNNNNQVCEGEWIRTRNGRRYCKTYRIHTSHILSDNVHPVYLNYRPIA